MSQAKIALGVSGVFLFSAAAYVAYDSSVEKSRLRQGIYREFEKKQESIREHDKNQRESFEKWKEDKKAENRKKREEMNKVEDTD